jgi:hypothetical protein
MRSELSQMKKVIETLTSDRPERTALAPRGGAHTRVRPQPQAPAEAMTAAVAAAAATAPRRIVDSGGSKIAITAQTNNVGNRINVDNSADHSVDKTINNTVSVDKSIHINIFGKEDTSHITRNDIWKIFNALGPVGADLRRLAEQTILRTAMLIYSDEAHPENITCYIPNKKSKEVMVREEKGWRVQPVDLTLSPMAAKSVNELFKKQPLPGVDGIDDAANLDTCTKILRHILDHEGDLTAESSGLRAIPIRNKSLLEQVLAKLPGGK